MVIPCDPLLFLIVGCEPSVMLVHIPRLIFDTVVVLTVINVPPKVRGIQKFILTITNQFEPQSTFTNQYLLAVTVIDHVQPLLTIMFLIVCCYAIRPVLTFIDHYSNQLQLTFIGH